MRGVQWTLINASGVALNVVTGGGEQQLMNNVYCRLSVLFWLLLPTIRF